ncbi:MAG: acetate/propionate family kinase [Methyloversatilis sp.]|jgi:acetate kinase|nr:acetate/propionate family kinase [Methyloversatilis sp.]MBP6193535.1 acetate/propionate family kinase [Methyloversatilis sp.]MBP9116781.1 acetate/propionate family kinase [Methyloversatilis sp.]
MNDDAVLTLNAGSSSIKFALFALPSNRRDVPQQARIVGRIDGIGAAGRQARLTAEDATGERMDGIELPFEGPAESQYGEVLRFLVRWLREHEAGWRVTAVGHRVVHGGQRFSAPTLLDPQVIATLRGFVPLAPLHQPHNLAGIDAMAGALPGVPQVACFDTAFHRTQPDIAQMFALPRRITAEGVLRYGFHGLSYEFIADVLPQHLPAAQADGRVIVAHLGNGASMCGMVARRSQATSMGFTAVDGLMMGTRTGSLDPGVLLYLMEHHGMDAQALTRLLYSESGLLGVSGLSSDMRTLLESDTAEAAQAVDLFCYRAVREIGSLAGAIEGIDALVFTGGIGEHAAAVRERICRPLAWTGLTFDAPANAACATRISSPASRVAVCVIPTNEEWMIARHTAELL